MAEIHPWLDRTHTVSARLRSELPHFCCCCCCFIRKHSEEKCSSLIVQELVLPCGVTIAGAESSTAGSTWASGGPANSSCPFNHHTALLHQCRNSQKAGSSPPVCVLANAATFLTFLEVKVWPSLDGSPHLNSNDSWRTIQVRGWRQEADRCLFKHDYKAEESKDQKSLHLSYILGKTTDGVWPVWADDREQVCENVTASGQVWNSRCASSSDGYPLQDSQNSFGMSVLKSSHLNHIEGESFSQGSVNIDSAFWSELGDTFSLKEKQRTAPKKFLYSWQASARA